MGRSYNSINVIRETALDSLRIKTINVVSPSETLEEALSKREHRVRLVERIAVVFIPLMSIIFIILFFSIGIYQSHNFDD